MAVNGVSHHVVEDDLAGCAAVLQWLSFVPAVLGSQPPTLVGSDPVERPIVYAPGPGAQCWPLQSARPIGQGGGISHIIYILIIYIYIYRAS